MPRGPAFAGVLVLAALLLGGREATAADDVATFRAAIEPLYEALTSLAAASTAGSEARITEAQTRAEREAERLRGIYGPKLVNAPAPVRPIVDALGEAYLKIFTFSGLAKQFGGGFAASQPDARAFLDAGQAALQTVRVFLQARP